MCIRDRAVTLENFGPAKQSAGAYTVKAYDASVIRQPSCGQVDLSLSLIHIFLCGSPFLLAKVKNLCRDTGAAA